MADAREDVRRGLSGVPDLDEVQRGQEQPVTMEALERADPSIYKETREVPIPDPGERPGAIRAGEAPRDGEGEGG